LYGNSLFVNPWNEAASQDPSRWGDKETKRYAAVKMRVLVSFIKRNAKGDNFLGPRLSLLASILHLELADFVLNAAPTGQSTNNDRIYASAASPEALIYCLIYRSLLNGGIVTPYKILH
jgi:hypothetical protein